MPKKLITIKPLLLPCVTVLLLTAACQPAADDSEESLKQIKERCSRFSKAGETPAVRIAGVPPAQNGYTFSKNAIVGSQPNIIFVLTDDQSMGDLSCMGNPILDTPHIDRLYEQSTRFADFHASPTCSPTRSALMSGRRPFEVGVSHTVLQRERMSLDVVTLPETLKTAGYTTALFGKWHLGDEAEYRPQNRGFDEVLMFGGGGIGQYRWGDFEANTTNRYFDCTLLHNETVVQTKGYCTDLFFDAALA